eukprot:591736-Prymnesium_polylepis.1
MKKKTLRCIQGVALLVRAGSDGNCEGRTGSSQIPDGRGGEGEGEGGEGMEKVWLLRWLLEAGRGRCSVPDGGTLQAAGVMLALRTFSRRRFGFGAGAQFDGGGGGGRGAHDARAAGRWVCVLVVGSGQGAQREAAGQRRFGIAVGCAGAGGARLQSDATGTHWACGRALCGCPIWDFLCVPA